MNHRNRFPARRRFLKQSAALSAGASLAAPAVLAHVHQPGIKLGLLHPVSGPDAAVGRACREAALLALHEVNTVRNARGLAPLLAVCADAALHPQLLPAVEAMHAQGVDLMLALLPEVASLQRSVSAGVTQLALLRLAPAALGGAASPTCETLLQSLPPAAQLAVASSYSTVLAVDAVLGEQGSDDIAAALRDAGLATPIAVTGGGGAQAVLLVPGAGTLAQARLRRA